MIKKNASLGVVTLSLVCAYAEQINPAYCNHNKIKGDTAIVTNVEQWASGKFATTQYVDAHIPGNYQSVSGLAMTAVQPPAIEDMANKNWVTNLLENKVYNINTDDGRKTLASDLATTFGGKTVQTVGLMSFKQTAVPANTTMKVSGISGSGNVTVDWGDGTQQVLVNPTSDMTFQHIYINPGTYTFTFKEGRVSGISGTMNLSFIRDSSSKCYVTAADFSKNKDPIELGMCMFANQPIEELVLPENVTSIGAGCFAQCRKLKKVEIFAPMTSAATYAMSTFKECTALGDVRIGGKCVKIPSYCFWGCSSLSNVTYDAGCIITDIETGAFTGCTSLKEMHVPEGVTSFSLGYATAVTNLTLPSTLKSLGEIQLADRSTKKTFELPPNLETTYSTFHSWSNLEYIKLPKTMKNLGSGTFAFCSSLTNVEFEAGAKLTRVGGLIPNQMPGAFHQCTSLKEIAIPFENPKMDTTIAQYPIQIGSESFNGCSLLKSAVFDFEYGNGSNIGGAYNLTSGIFVGCPNVETITIGSSYPPVLNTDNAFGTGLSSSLKIFIPYLSSTNYLNAYRWSNQYGNRIVESSPGKSRVSIKCDIPAGIQTRKIRLGPTYGDDIITVDWGDGVVDTVESGASPIHTYSFVYDSSQATKSPSQMIININSRVRKVEGCCDASGNPAYSYVATMNGSSISDCPIAYFKINNQDDSVKIGDYCFKSSSIRSFEVDKMVSSIGNNSFYGSSALTGVTFNDRGIIESIGVNAFRGCGMSSIAFPKSLYDIGNYAFYGCPITSFTCSRNGNLENIGNYAFTGNQVETFTKKACIMPSITIPNTVKTIGDGAFQYCWNLTSLNLPQDGVLESIGTNAFEEAILLSQALNVPKSVKKIGNSAFSTARVLTSINFSQDGVLEEIGDKAFYDTRLCTSVSIPKTVKYIGDNAFYSGLTTLTIPVDSQLEHLGYMYDTVNITSGINLPSSLKYFGGYYSWKIGGTPYVPTLPDAVEYIGPLGGNDSHQETSFTLPSNVKTLNATFNGWGQLKSIELPSGVESISRAFYNCGSMTNVVFVGGCPNMRSIQDYAFSNCGALKDVVIPNGVTSIGRDSFYYCTSLTNVAMSSGLTSIGYESFANCTELKSVVLPSSLKKTGYCSFWYCTKLSSVTLPSGITEIGPSSFSRTALTEVNIPATVTAVGSDAFGSIGSLATVRIYATTPPVCKDYYGSDKTNPLGSSIPAGCIIYVPSASVTAYKLSNYWKTYKNNIVGM